MIMQCFCIRDDKASLFLTPFFARNSIEATRQVQAVANDPKNMLSLHGEDFSLYMLGSMDDETGWLAAQDVPVHLCKVSQLKKEVPNVKA